MTNSKIIRIVSKYFGMYPYLRRADIVLSRRIISSLKGSKFWHTDNVDTRLVKLFIYLTDVLNDDYGPFILSEKNKESSKRFRKIINGGHWEDKKLQKMDIKLDPFPIFGSRGTSFLVDKAIVPHKGSIKLKDDKVVFVATYSSHSHWMDMETNLKYDY